MAINLQALTVFRGAAEWSDNTMLNLDKENGVRQSGTYRFILNALGRGRKAETANNEVRTELVRALVRAFDLDAGARDGTNISDKTLDRLAELIGPVFKREDFTVGPNGAISSGRPLTARRIKAILARVDAAAKAETGRATLADEGVREIAVGGPKLPAGKAMALVNAAVEFVNGSDKAAQYGIQYSLDLDDAQRDMAAGLVAKYGAGLSDTCQRILANFVVNAIAQKTTELGEDDADGVKEAVEDIARELAESIRNARSFKPGAPETAELDATLTAYWQDLLADSMGPAGAGHYDEEGLFDNFKKDADRDTYRIGGEVFAPKSGMAEEVVGKFKEMVANKRHRKALSTFMSQLTGNFIYMNVSAQNPLPATTKFPHFNLKSVKGFDLLLSADRTGGTFDEGLTNKKGTVCILDVGADGTTANVVVKSFGAVRFNVTDAHEWGEIPMGSCDYELTFSFDLSDPDEAKLTAVHLGQTIEVSEP